MKRENSPPLKINQPYIYMFNHASMFDQFMIGAYINHYLTAVAAIEIFKYPLWGQVLNKYGIIPIYRKKIKKALTSLSEAEKRILSGASILIAPEGTRTTDGKLGDFKKGPFHLAKNSGATIIPIGLIGAFEAKKKTDWRIKPGQLIVKFGDPITRIEYSKMSIAELRDLVKDRINKLIY
ncbi:1-acyl-sn-glycerol-3-phosphate acyltransferase [Candidatus Marinimicrobia bacterium]|nr:1-acyl-sn-glycerol-3-phosphate acyltransferase [Candidatus Neomarinimicrobiota bacterium]